MKSMGLAAVGRSGGRDAAVDRTACAAPADRAQEGRVVATDLRTRERTLPTIAPYRRFRTSCFRQGDSTVTPDLENRVLTST